MEKMVHLPEPLWESRMSLETALYRRRSVREYLDEPLSVNQVGQLLWAAQGITSGGKRRTAPSAGALYPLELYLVAGEVEGLAPGVYRYLPQEHALATVLPGDRRGELCAAALQLPAIRQAPASLVFTAVFRRTTGKYGERGVRYVYMDEGHAAENVHLEAVSLGLGTFVVGAFADDAVKIVLSLPAQEEPLTIMPVGRVR